MRTERVGREELLCGTIATTGLARNWPFRQMEQQVRAYTLGRIISKQLHGERIEVVQIVDSLPPGKDHLTRSGEHSKTGALADKAAYVARTRAKGAIIEPQRIPDPWRVKVADE
ncbi:hypothetical protein Vse01_54180 [Micromonospora sediminimaris]|uniref:Uncharacterized protein n=1 Tax=Micromonospora sediminimaris TaxID=547162 RepID=A0A9W5UY76_9ACTN|nr:hypothetical protein Vse01_54180 [Micromonospora sediminimaris]